MADYLFTVELAGSGDSEGDAWTDAVDGFCADPGEPTRVRVATDQPDYVTYAEHVREARERYTRDTDDIEIDACPAMSVASDGVWVQGWLYVPNSGVSNG